MVLPGYKVASYIKNIITEKQIQPAGVDLTVYKIFRFTSKGHLGISERYLSETVELKPVNGKWFLSKGIYKVLINEIISIPEDIIGICLPRSSLLRMGADIRCALWDPGYYGRSEFLLIVYNEHGITLEVNSRIAQLVFIKLLEKPHKIYEGKYKGENI